MASSFVVTGSVKISHLAKHPPLDPISFGMVVDPDDGAASQSIGKAARPIIGLLTSAGYRRDPSDGFRLLGDRLAVGRRVDEPRPDADGTAPLATTASS